MTCTCKNNTPTSNNTCNIDQVACVCVFFIIGVVTQFTLVWKCKMHTLTCIKDNRCIYQPYPPPFRKEDESETVMGQ